VCLSKEINRDPFDEVRYRWIKHRLNFKLPSGTSRGVLKTKDSWFLIAENEDWKYPALGEVSIIEGLSPDVVNDIEPMLDQLCDALAQNRKVDTINYPAINFARESMELDIRSNGAKIFENNPFTTGEDQILINGLIWMGKADYMLAQVKQKVLDGFRCLKLKIGAIDFEEEIEILSWIRKEFNEDELEIRVDANGAFTPETAMDKLNRLAEFQIHSIEQPIAPKQWSELATLCERTPINIALDEELIGIKDQVEKQRCLDAIKPHYIILKPSLVGGFQSADEWTALAEERSIGWWITSALESNVGLNAIAQYAYSKKVQMPQGLGTGGLFTNNIDSPLYIHRQFLKMNPDHIWNLKPLNL
jgi:o-succinylbenzoate synthase